MYTGVELLGGKAGAAASAAAVSVNLAIQYETVHSCVSWSYDVSTSALCAVMCREQAVRVWRMKDMLGKLGVQVYGLVHEPAWKEVCSIVTCLAWALSSTIAETCAVLGWPTRASDCI